MTPFRLLVVLILGIGGAAAADERLATLDSVLDRAGVDAAFVIESLDGSIQHVHNPVRAATRFSPASTFKVPNTLLALDAGVVSGNGVEFHWDGSDRGIETWNADHSLASALRVSCVWCYQEVARQLGRQRYEDELRRLGYGNATVGDEVDRFWLDGSLAISALEQVGFLRRLFEDPPPFPAADIEQLENMMLIEAGNSHVLRAKSGWTGAELHTGWYIGTVETASETWLFALNLDMDSAEQAPLRKNLTMEALEALGIIRRE